jgi:hypothetical protein
LKINLTLILRPGVRSASAPHSPIFFARQSCAARKGNSFSASSSEIEKSHSQVSSISMQRQCNARWRVARMKFGKRKCLFQRSLDSLKSLQKCPHRSRISELRRTHVGSCLPPCLGYVLHALFQIHVACLDDCQVRQILQHGPLAHARADCLAWKSPLAKLKLCLSFNKERDSE